MANDILPGRLGEIIRAHAIGRIENISRSASFATIVLERIFDGFSLLFFLAVILLLGTSLPGWLHRASIVALVFYCLSLVVLVVIFVRTKFILSIFEKIILVMPDRVRARLLAVFNSFANGLVALSSVRSAGAAIIFSPLVWLPNVAMIYLLLVSFGIYLPFDVSVLLLVALCLGVMIPSAPGFVGTIQYVSVSVLSLFGVSRSVALSFSIIYHACIFIPTVLLGVIFLIKRGFSIKDIVKMGKDDEVID